MTRVVAPGRPNSPSGTVWRERDGIAWVDWDDPDPDLMPPYKVAISELELLDDGYPFEPAPEPAAGEIEPEGEWAADWWRAADALDEEMRGVPLQDVYG